MAMNESQEKRFHEYFEQLKKADSMALAMELAAILVMVPMMPVEKTLANVRATSKKFRESKRNQTHNNKLHRLEDLLGKKRLSKVEKDEVFKLAKELKIPFEEITS